MSSSGKWVSILDYSRIKEISVSTIRRYIKANRVESRLVDGKYQIFISEALLDKANDENKEILKLKFENEELKRINKRLVEENNDLKTLVMYYESKNILPSEHFNEELPALPE